MADYSAYQRGPGQTFYPQHAHTRNLPTRVRSPTNSGRILFNPDTPSPSRSPGPQSPQQFGMFNQGHGHQGHNVMMNGGANHQRYAMQMNLGKPFQHNQNHQHHSHAHQQHQEHTGATHTGQYNHQHTASSGGISNVQPHFATTHLQNGTPGSVNSGLSKPPNEHWAEQLQLAQRAREMTQSHSHARNHPSVNKNVVAGTTNGNQKEADKEERNRPVALTTEVAQANNPWTVLDFGGQNLKVVTSALFQYTFLTKLYLNCNKLTSLPAEIGCLRSLTHLDISLNELRYLPPEIGMLVNLKQLLLFDNHLDVLPYDLGSLYQLEMLGIEGNPIPEDLKSITVEHGTTELIKHFRENAPGPPPPTERDWIVLDDVTDSAQETVSALSYNILCDKYCTQSQYGYTPSGALAWDHRRDTILAELRERNADIVCLQEIDQESFNDYFRASLAHDDYKGFFWPKTRAKTMAEREARLVDGCAIFYKNSKYILLDKQLIDFANTAINRPDMKGEHDIFNRVMPRDDIAVVAFLENRMTGSRLIVGNVHVFWNPAYRDVKLVQVAILMEGITRLANKWAKFPACTEKGMYRYTNGDGEDGKETPDVTQEPGPSLEYAEGSQIPLVLCGDFNSLPDSGVYDLIVQGSVSNSHSDLGSRKYGNFTRDGISHPFSLKSSYSAIGEMAFTNYTPGFVGVLDYIWYSTNTLQVVGLLGDINKEYLKRVPGFPNYHFPSDHVALYAQYIVKGRKERKVVEPDFGPGRDRDRRN
ncbi:glucose-repressible alcohol dehydrogenase-like protein transcriptional effector [Massariosphaeria phaeospora]|uniref:CCR4-Not complex 3'-5'-exoribonuclease subunit Ccr4 n=1 Tax=Massariosphaeria phaeospora TaxID=100035 RepID=A0A7C8M589_9PLEO|nr:glucose-repressible alcohol dehydrogenase-like protein transcriptional effector [Massariosphaeria phaeospora]